MKIGDDKLNKMLKQARVPERSPGYWEVFPQRVTRQLAEQPAAARRGGLLWAIGLTAACVVLAVAIFIGRAGNARDTAPVSYAQLYRQIEALFPNQVQAIVVDRHGVKLLLADNANVVQSPPVLIQACRQDECRRVITFSGQQVKVNGDTWDVLVNGQDQVVVAGRSTDRYRIETQRLGGVL